MSKEAMKLALEALEKAHDESLDEDHFKCRQILMEQIIALREALAEQPAQTDWEAVAADQAMTIALIKAEQPARQQEPVGALILGGVVDTSDGPEYEEWDIEWNHKAIESLQERLVTHNPVTLNIYTSPPAAQQEPVAWPIDGDTAKRIADRVCVSYETVQQVARELAAPQPAQQQEPVAWATRMGEYAHIHWGAKRPEYPMVYEVPLYTSPPASKPLTDEEQIAEALRRHSLTLVKTAKGYDVMSLGHITAHGIKEKNT